MKKKSSKVTRKKTKTVKKVVKTKPVSKRRGGEGLRQEDVLLMAREFYLEFGSTRYQDLEAVVRRRFVNEVAYTATVARVVKYVTKHDPVVAFKHLDPAEQRVVIAKDVLTQLAMGEMVAKAGTYFRHLPPEGVVLKGTDEVGDVLNQHPQCSVCVLGALFVAAVRKADQLRVGALQDISWTQTRLRADRNVLTNYLDDYFDDEQISLIESAFEGCEFGDHGKRSAGFRGMVCKKNPIARVKPEERDRLVMIEIMNNIIRHNGKFVPPARAKAKPEVQEES